MAELATTGKIGNVSTRPRLNITEVRSRLRFQEGEEGRSPGVRSFGQRDGRIPQKLSAREGHPLGHCIIRGARDKELYRTRLPRVERKSQKKNGIRLPLAAGHGASVLAATGWIVKSSRDLARVDKMGLAGIWESLGCLSRLERVNKREKSGAVSVAGQTRRIGQIGLCRLGRLESLSAVLPGQSSNLACLNLLR